MLATGYFERGNLGDDLMRQAVEAGWADGAPLLDVRYLRLPAFGIRHLGEAIAFGAALARSDALVLLGGTHLHARYGRRSTRLLGAFTGLFMFARLSRTRIVLLCVGVEDAPSSSLQRFLIRLVLALASECLVRDPSSYAVVRRLAPRLPTSLSVDLAFALPRIDERSREASILAMSLVPRGELFEGRPELDDALADDVVAAVLEAAARTRIDGVWLLVANTGTPPNDYGPAAYIRERLGRTLPTEIVVVDTPDAAFAAMRLVSGVVATRYHVALLAALAGRPLALLCYQAKCEALARQIGLDDALVLRAHPDRCELVAVIEHVMGGGQGRPGNYQTLARVARTTIAEVAASLAT